MTHFIVCASILYRLLTGAPRTTASMVALALLLLMAGNEAWNNPFLRRRNLRDGFVA